MNTQNKIMKTFIYTPSIPTGTARTKGYGKTRDVYVIRADENFKTLNSKKSIQKMVYVGRARFDYGTKRGKSAKLLAEASEILKTF